MARLLVDGDSARQPDVRQFELADWIDTAPLEDLIGLEIKQASAGKAVLSVPFLVKLSNGGGVMHGGVLVALADTAVAMAIKSLLPQETVFATVELKMDFLAPVRSGRVTAQASVSGPEGRTFQGKAELLDDQKNLVARFTSVFRVARGQGFCDASEC